MYEVSPDLGKGYPGCHACSMMREPVVDDVLCDLLYLKGSAS